MIYLDTSALVKLVRREPESDDLVDWLGDQHTDLVTSTLVEVELPRALRRAEPSLLAAVPALLERMALYEMTELVRATAAGYEDPHLRSLDAIHLATADAGLGAVLTWFVSYDHRLTAAADLRGLRCAGPGRQSC